MRRTIKKQRNMYIQKTHPAILLTKILFVVALLFAAHTSLAATLSVSPGTGVYTAGQTFTARVVVNTAGANVNAAEGVLSFKPGELSVVGVSKGSIFNLWTAEPSFSNSAGTISFSGGTPSGYTGGSGTVISVTFRTKGAGNPRVSFSSGAVLAADGRGTNVLSSMNGGSFTVASAAVIPEPETIEYIAPANTPAAPTITSDTHSDPEAYHAATTAELKWTLPSGVTAVRTLLDEQSGTIPTKVYDDPIASITIDELEEGVQYFHLQFRNADGWGRVTHYRLAVDTGNPSSFDIALVEGTDLSNPEQVLILTAEDETSEVKRFLIQIDAGEPYEFIDTQGVGQITLSSLEPGHHSIIIEAFDEAGNSLINSFSFGILAFDRPQFTEFPVEVSQNVIPVIKGITRPNSEVRLMLTKLGTDTQEYTLQSNESGEFVYIPESRFTLGVYELSAVAVDQYGAQSEVSETVRIAVQEPGYVRIGSIAVSILSVFVPVLALLALTIFMLWFLWGKLRRLRTGVSREAHEAMSMLQVEFGMLQKLIQTQSATLAASRKNKKLTKAEAELVESLTVAMNESQKKVAKEITDVEDIVD